MGIGTLIIFISTILVAAVAAGVLISTSGTLQQRALMTGEEARKKITDSVEATSIVAYGNKTEESLNDFEVFIRLDAGSDPIQMRGFGLSFIGPRQHTSAKLTHPSLNDPRHDPEGFLENVSFSEDIINDESQVELRDLDGDGIGERIGLHVREGSDALVVNFSGNEADYAFVDLGKSIDDLDEGSVLTLEDGPIIGQDLEHYGFINLRANVTAESSLDLSGENSFVKLSKHYLHECKFDIVPYENKFCFEVMHGDEDTVLEQGEMFVLKFRLKPENKMYTGQGFEFILHTEKGRLRSYHGRTPDVIVTERIPLWPLN